MVCLFVLVKCYTKSKNLKKQLRKPKNEVLQRP